MDGYTSEDGKVYPSIEQRMANGRLAIDALKNVQNKLLKNKNDALASQSLQTLDTTSVTAISVRPLRHDPSCFLWYSIVSG